MAVQRVKIQPETQFGYFNKLKGRALQFRPKSDEVVATVGVRGAADDAVRRQVESAFASVSRATTMAIGRGADAKLGFAVYRVPPSMTAEQAADQLRQSADVANSIPALEDEDGNTRYVVPDEFTVQFDRQVAPLAAEAIIANHGSKILVKQRTPGYYTISVPANKSLFESIDEFNRLPEVKFAEFSEMGFDDALAYVPDDPLFPDQWALNNVGQTGGTPDADMDVVEAWDLERGKAEIIVAVIDTGAEMNHPDLVANILPQGTEDWNFADGPSTVPVDTDGHGTHVAGIVAGVDNTVGIVGVAPRCRIMPLKINLSAGMNQNRADAINYVTGQALAHPTWRYIINGSWRMSGDMSAVQLAIEDAELNNVLLLFAAGNTSGGAVTFPAKYPQTVAVANTDHQDRIDWSSAVGPEVDVSAPGTDILSCFIGGGHATLTGTSMACPNAAGVAALTWSRNPSLTNKQVRKILEDNCDNIDALNPGLGGLIGHGRVNAFRTVQRTPLPVTLVRSFPFPYNNTGGGDGSALAFADNFPFAGSTRAALLFLTQTPFSERIVFVDPTTGAPFGFVNPVGNVTIGSLEWTGTQILAGTISPNGWIKRLNPLTGAEVARIFAPSGRGQGLGRIGNTIYYSTVTKIHRIDLITEAILGQFPAPGGDCFALAGHGDRLFCGNSTRGVVTVFDVATSTIFGDFPVPGGGVRAVDGLAYDPATKELFVANQSLNTIFVLRLDF